MAVSKMAMPTGTVALDEPARDVADSELDEQLAASYGIFSGPPKPLVQIGLVGELPATYAPLRAVPLRSSFRVSTAQLLDRK